jgi:hypothetical protein
MGEIVQDTSTGFMPEEELLLLAGTPEELAGGIASTWVCATIVIATEISQALDDACPTSACSTRC